MSTRARRWMATVYAPDLDGEEAFLWLRNRVDTIDEHMTNRTGAEVTWIKGQLEACPISNRNHIQVAAEFKHPVTRETVQQLFWETKCHCEPIRYDKNGNYGVKDETRAYERLIQWGTLPETVVKHQGQRTEIQRCQDLIDQGATELEVMRAVPSAIRMIRGLDRYRELSVKQRGGEMTELHILWGEGGTGKSRWCHENYPDAYWLPPTTGYKWWDGYRGQETVIIDEFNPREMNFDRLKRLIDRYPLQVEYKGGSINFTAKRLILTSNEDPTRWYGREQLASDAWARRVTSVRYFNEAEFKPEVWNWAKQVEIFGKPY